MKLHKHKLAVDEFTSPCPYTVGLDTPVADVITLMQDNGIRHIPVVDKERAVGIISERDIHLVTKFSDESNLSAEAVMSATPYAVGGDTDLAEVALQMSRNKIGSAIVNDEEGKVVGIFTSTDALNALVELLRGEI